MKKPSDRVYRPTLSPPFADAVSAADCSTEAPALLRDNPAVAAALASDADEAAEVADPFPLDAFPCGPVADMAKAIRTSARVPDSLAGCCVLGAVSAALGRGLQVNSLPNCKSRANLAIVASGQSGTGKSVAFNLALEPLCQKQAELTTRWRREKLAPLLARKDVLEAEIKTLKARAGRQESEEREGIVQELTRAQANLLELEGQLHAPRLYVEDATVQALAEVLARDPGESTASLSADAGEAVNILLGRYNPTKRADDSLLVKAWTGDTHTVDRMGRSFALAQPCLTILWLLQREKLDTLVAHRGLSDGGFVPRLLVCHTDCQPQHVDRGQPPIDPAIKNEYRQLLEGLIDRFRQRSVPLTIDPTREARDTLDRQHDAVVDRRVRELHDVSSYPARWNEQTWRIALCLHAARWGEAAGEQALQVETAEGAIRIQEWFARQQLEILFMRRAQAQAEHEEKVVAFLVGKTDGATARDLQRGPLRGLPAAMVQEFMGTLESKCRVAGHDLPAPGGGRSTRRYRLCLPETE